MPDNREGESYPDNREKNKIINPDDRGSDDLGPTSMQHTIKDK